MPSTTFENIYVLTNLILILLIQATRESSAKRYKLYVPKSTIKFELESLPAREFEEHRQGEALRGEDLAKEAAE